MESHDWEIRFGSLKNVEGAITVSGSNYITEFERPYIRECSAAKMSGGGENPLINASTTLRSAMVPPWLVRGREKGMDGLEKK